MSNGLLFREFRFGFIGGFPDSLKQAVINGIRFIALILTPVLPLISCGQPVTDAPDGRIIFPLDGSVFLEGDSISFQAEISRGTCSWKRTEEIEIGTGPKIQCILPVGEHEIGLWTDDVKIDEIRLSVRTSEYRAGELFLIIVNRETQRKLLPAGRYWPYIVSAVGENETGSFRLSLEGFPVPGNTSRCGIPALKREEPLRDVVGSLPGELRRLKKTVLTRSVAAVPAEVGDVRTFRMADPEKGTNVEGFSVSAVCSAVTDRYELWTDEESIVDSTMLDQIWSMITGRISRRLENIWGEPADIDGNGRTVILMTGKLNAGRIAIGFFNPCDFFPYSDDIGSAGYNPTSNEMDIIYLGIPVSDPEDRPYSSASIMATSAHELSHLIRFSRKTYVRRLQGRNDPPVEETFLEEGLAHLTENLVGLGVSGGNYLFIRKYLESPFLYSLTSRDAYGSSDSAGKRGAMTLFLNWMFERSGGAVWSAEDPVSDTGGITFLRQLVESSDTGARNLEIVTGQSFSSLMEEWSFHVASLVSGYAGCSDRSVQDPVTGEPLYFDVFTTFNEKEILSGPSLLSSFELVHMLPGSAVWFESIILPEKSIGIIQGNDISGSLLAGFLMY